VHLACQAGFSEVRLEFQVTVRGSKEPTPWDRFMRTSGNPLQPAFEQVLDQALSQQEATALVDHLRPLVEMGIGLERTALAYLVAVKG
jgi:hypothetical protein